jgi:hypothetical protein
VGGGCSLAISDDDVSHRYDAGPRRPVDALVKPGPFVECAERALRRKALEAFPQLRHELQNSAFTIYQLFFELQLVAEDALR